MVFTEQEDEVILDEFIPELYPSWDAFVKTKLDRANELLSQMDQAALYALINPAPKPISEEIAG